MLRRLPPSLVLALAQFVVEGSAFLRNLVLARLIGADDMGLAVAIAVGVRIFEMMGDFGLERWLVQVRAGALDSARGTVHWLQAAKGCVLMALAMTLAAPLTAVLQPRLDPAVFALAAIAIGIRGFVNCDYRERQRERDYVGVLQVEGASNLVALVAVIPIALLTRDYSAIAWASILQAAVLSLLSHVVARRVIAFHLDPTTLREALRFGIPVSGNAILMFLAMQGDRLIVAAHFEPRALAAFAIAAQLTLLPALAGARFLLTFDLPRCARLVAGTREWQGYFRVRLMQVTGVSAVLAITLGLFGNRLIEFLYGSEFVTETAVLELLACAAGLRLMRAVPSTMLMAAGRTPMLLAGNLPRILALIVAIVALADGAGLSTVVAIGAASEAIGLVIGLAAVAGGRRAESRLTHSPLGSS
jgi:O-antigen/teichoic acid export membrane protein